jgi:shikimate kinase
MIFITGYMGSGKSTFGKRLARHLDYDFLDLDKIFEESYKICISNFFVKYGEEMFRRIEHDLLVKNLGHSNTVISCGGGTPCYFDNMDQMNAAGLTIYLRLTPAALVNRLENSRKERPLLQKLPGVDLLEKITNHLQQREPFYLKSQLELDGLNISIEEATAKVLKQLPRQDA